MKNNYKNILFFLICFFLIFNNTPKIIQMNFWGGPVGNKLIFYPFIAGFIYTVYCQYKYKNVLIYFDKFLKFTFIYIAVTMLSLIMGLYTYPYYDLVFSSPVGQIEKLPYVLAFFASHGIVVDQKFALGAWMIVRQVKGVFLETFWCFGGAYMIFCWYYNNWQQAVRITTKGVLAGLVVVFTYSAIEIFYFTGNETAKNLLVVITPYFHSVKNDGTWWPPLLWRGQLRSVFAEPSYLGIYGAFAISFLWNSFINMRKDNYKYLYCIAFILFSFFIFLTKARTAVALFASELFLLIIFTIYLREKLFFKRTLTIMICSTLAFWGANYFINNCMMTTNIAAGSDLIAQTNKYFSENFASLASTNERSNGARYSIMLADLKIGLDNPVLGVGSNLRNAYIPHYLPDRGQKNSEVKMWIKNQREKGVLRSGFPRLGEYTVRFAENGVTGFFLFLMPSIFLILNLYKRINKHSMLPSEDKYDYIFFSIAFIGVLTSGIGDNLNITYCYWFLLGLGYAMCFDNDGIKKDKCE